MYYCGSGSFRSTLPPVRKFLRIHAGIGVELMWIDLVNESLNVVFITDLLWGDASKFCREILISQLNWAVEVREGKTLFKCGPIFLQINWSHLLDWDNWKDICALLSCLKGKQCTLPHSHLGRATPHYWYQNPDLAGRLNLNSSSLNLVLQELIEVRSCWRWWIWAKQWTYIDSITYVRSISRCNLPE